MPKPLSVAELKKRHTQSKKVLAIAKKEAGTAMKSFLEKVDDVDLAKDYRTAGALVIRAARDARRLETIIAERQAES